MNRIDLYANVVNGKKPTIMIFTEGTILEPKIFIGYFNHKKYVPIKNCVEKIKKWNDQGSRIIYLTSRKTDRSTEAIKNLLIKYGFPGDHLYYRTGNEKYRDVVESIKPDILIEDNCRSIGGKWQMAITHVDKKIRDKIKSIVVHEFEGIDFLPDNLNDLMEYGNC